MTPRTRPAATAPATRPPVNQLALFELPSDQAADTRPGGATFSAGGALGRRRMPDGPGHRPMPESPPARPAGRRADRGGAPALTPRLAEIIAAMVDAVLDSAASDSSAIRGKVMTPRSRQRDPGAATGPFGGRR